MTMFCAPPSPSRGVTPYRRHRPTPSTYPLGNRRTYGGTPKPHPMASHHCHLPHPQQPHTHLAAHMGGHLRGPPPRTPRPHTHPPHPPPTEMGSPGATRHTHPRDVGIHHTHEPTGSGRHQGHPLHPTSANPNPTPQHAAGLHNLVGVPRPKHAHPPTGSPPPLGPQHNRPPPSRDRGSLLGRGPGILEPEIPGGNESRTARARPPRETPRTETAPPPTQTRRRRRVPTR